MSESWFAFVFFASLVAAASVQAKADWHKVFEQNNDVQVMSADETLEQLKKLAGDENLTSVDERDAPNKEQLEELIDFCNMSNDKCRAGYLRDLKIKTNYHAFTKQWTLNRYLEKCLQDQELFCSRNIDAGTEQALGTLPSNKLQLINLMFDKLRGQLFPKGSLAFAAASNLDYQQIFSLCLILVDTLETQMDRYRWLKDENLEHLVKKKETGEWLTNGERCKYFLANRYVLSNQVSKYQETMRMRGRFADSKPSQKV